MQPEAERRSLWPLVAAVAGAALLAFLPALRNGFTYDDFPAVQDNSQLRALLRPSTYLGQAYFAASGETTYRPLVSFSYALDYALWGKAPAAYHVTNLLLHALASALLLAACRSLGAARPVALAAALLYAVHPLGSEAVCAAGFREDLLCAIFGLAAFALWPSAPESAARPPDRRLRHKPSTLPAAVVGVSAGARFGLAWAALLLALLSKEMALALPLLLLAKDLRRGGRSLVRSRAAWHAGAWALAGAFLVLFLTFHGEDAGFAKPAGDVGLLRRAAGFPGVVLRYLALFAVPYPLCVDRQWDLSAASFWPGALGSAACLCVLGALCFRWRVRFAPAWESLVAFVLLLVPVSNLVRLDHPLAERYLALPLAPLCYALAQGLARAVGLRPRMAILGALLLAGVALSWARCADWWSERTLWAAEVRHNPASAQALASLGGALAAAGETGEAERLLREAVRLRPDHPEALCCLGALEESLGDAPQAEALLRRAIDARPRYAMAHATLAHLLAAGGRGGEAAGEIALARRYGPADASVCNTAGTVHTLLGNAGEAEKAFRAALELDPGMYQPLVSLGQMLAGRRDYDGAAALYRRALTRQPGGPEALEGLGVVLLNTGHAEAAAELFARWTQAQPGLARAYYCLGTALTRAGRQEGARTAFERGLRLAREAGDAPGAAALERALAGLPAK